MELPEILGHKKIFTDFMHTALPSMASLETGLHAEYFVQAIAALVSLAGIYLAYVFFLRNRQLNERIVQTPIGSTLHRLWFSGWGFDWFYNILFIKPYTWFADFNRNDYLDKIYIGIAGLSRIAHQILCLTQTGKLRWYLTGIAVGATIIIGVVVFL